MNNFTGAINYPMGSYQGFARDMPGYGDGMNYGGYGASFGYDYSGGKIPSLAAPIPSMSVHHPPTIGGATPMSAGSLTSNTSSKDPRAMISRVFVGNLNTSIVTREQLHSIYSPFGEILAISMHKGFAFVQFAHESEARNAVTFTDGSPLCGKKLDVTISSEPKSKSGDSASQTSKRFASSDDSGPQDYKKLRTSYPSGIGGQPTYGATSSPAVATTKTSILPAGFPNLSAEKLASGDDILICGSCRQLYSSIETFTEHKRACPNKAIKKEPAATSLVSSVKVENGSMKAPGEPENMRCSLCQTPFEHSWALILHMHDTHQMRIYEPVSSA